MLFKVFATLAVISLMGGFARCDEAASNQNDELMKLLTGMLNGEAGKNANENQALLTMLNTALEAMKDSKEEEAQLVQMLNKLLGNSAEPKAKSTENQVTKLLMDLLAATAKDTSKMDDQMVKMLMDLLAATAKESPKLNEQMMKLVLDLLAASAKDVPKSTDDQLMKVLTDLLGGAVKDAAKPNNNNQLTKLLMDLVGGITKDMSNDNEWLKLLQAIIPTQAPENKPKTCMATNNMAATAKADVAPWIQMLKVDGMKNLFGTEEDYKQFHEMIKYVESSPTDWLSILIKQVTDNKVLMTFGEEVVAMLEKDHNMRERLEKYVNSNAQVKDFVLKAVEWMKTADMSKTSPLVQKVVNIFMKMHLKPDEMNAVWRENFSDWVDCTFGKSTEIATLMKSIGMLSTADDLLMPMLKNMIGAGTYYPRKIKIQMKVFYTSMRCDKPIEVEQQSLYNIFVLVTQKQQLCTNTVFTTLQRRSTVTTATGQFLSSLGAKANSGNEMWKINILRNGAIVQKDVDLNYIPRDGDVVYCDFQ